MISCTEFIPAYSELFKYLEKKQGYEMVIDFWKKISDDYVRPRLGDLVDEHGFAGCYHYWTHSLNEEAADFTMFLDEEQGVFGIDMHDCPSKGLLLNSDHLTPYSHYCDHCDILYRRVLEAKGYTVKYRIATTEQAHCEMRVYDKGVDPDKVVERYNDDTVPKQED